MMIRYNVKEPELSKIKEAIRQNNGFCPCKLIKNEDTKCMCKDFRQQKEGVCHCGLYIKYEGKEE